MPGNSQPPHPSDVSNGTRKDGKSQTPYLQAMGAATVPSDVTERKRQKGGSV